jgi:hypothetical protein
MKTQKIIICLVLSLGCYMQTTCLKAQQDRTEIYEPIFLSGPRVGLTYIGDGEDARLLKEELSVNPFISQFGWQFESRFFTLSNGTSGLVEGVILLGGMEQNVVLPSANLLFGIRSPKGAEFGMGPSFSASGLGYVLAVGITFKAEHVNFPVNLAFEPSPNGAKFSLLIGFNARNR